VTPSHERPILVVLRPGERAGEALRRFLSHPAVRRHWMPPTWALEPMGIDLADALPDVPSVTLETLPAFVDAATRLATPEALDAYVARLWRRVDEQVRAFYLRRGLRGTFAAMLRVAPKTIDVEPPPKFRDDRIQEASLEFQYRIEPAPGDRNVLAPAEEASLVYYPFDPSNRIGRREAGLDEGDETVLEVFAYDDARTRQRSVLEDMARSTGWRVVDPAA
jgi:hypothetical protein